MTEKTPSSSAFDHRILQTKLHPPPLRSNLVERARLYPNPSAAPYKVSLVIAPAGFGKSTFVRTWMEQLGADYAWLSLDQRDNDLPRFLRYLAAAVQRLGDVNAGQVLALLESHPLPPVEAILTPLINALTQLDTPAYLVMDDYQTIQTPEIHGAVRFLIDHLPVRVQPVVVTRVDPAFPLAKYRARGELLEIRERDLRFSPEEIDDLMNGKLRLDLSGPEIRTLLEKTEGWAVGLQLVGVSLQQSESRSRFLETLSGESGYILEYLMEEVLSRLDDQTQTFLLHTSILRRFTPELCSAVTRQDNAGEILKNLDRQNVFLVPLDAMHTWYRYHHLFRDLLRFRLEQRHPEEIDNLHQRAGKWFEENDLIDEALDHAFRVSDNHQALEMLDRYCTHILVRSELSRYLDWVNQLPENELQTFPMILVGKAWALMFSNRSNALNRLIPLIERGLESEECDYTEPRKAEVRLILRILKAFWMRVGGNIHEAIDLSRDCLPVVPEDQPLFRGLLYYNMARSEMFLGYVDEPMELLNKAMEENLPTGNWYLLLSARGHLGSLTIQSRGPLAAVSRIENQLKVLDEQGINRLPAACYLHYSLGYARYLMNNLASAEEALDHAILLAEQGDDQFIVYNSLLVKAWCQIARGAVDEASQSESRAEEVFRQSHSGIFEADWETDRDYLALLANKFDQVKLNPNKIDPWEEEFSVIMETRALILIRTLLYDRKTEEASAALSGLEKRMGQRQRNSTRIILGILKTLIEYAREDKSEAYRVLGDILEFARNRGEIRPFLDSGEQFRTVLRHYCTETETSPVVLQFAKSLLSSMSAETVSATIPGFDQNLIDPLTEREQEVLRHIANGETYQQVANRMYVSLNTVKTHLKNLYSKMDVGSKSEAVEKAHALGLLGDTGESGS